VPLQRTLGAGDYAFIDALLQHHPSFQFSRRAVEKLLALGAAYDLDLQVRPGIRHWRLQRLPAMCQLWVDLSDWAVHPC